MSGVDDTVRTALVTGAGTGIGLATATALAGSGWRVLGTVLPGQDAAALRQAGIEPVAADLTDDGDRERLIRRLGEESRLDALVSNAGAAWPGPVEAMDADTLRAQFELNVVVPALLVRAVLPQLRRTRGRMVFIGAGQGRVALPFGGPYGASKAALAAITDALRAETAGSGVTVSLLEPGAVRTGILADSRARALRLLDELPGEVAARYREGVLATFARSERAFAGALPAETVAADVLRIVTAARPAPRRLLGREARALAVLAVLPARVRARLVGRIARP